MAKELWAAATPEFLCQFGESILQYGRLLGWPDLTLAKNGVLSLVEVKTKDKLRASQVALWFRLLRESGVDYRIVQLVQGART